MENKFIQDVSWVAMIMAVVICIAACFLSGFLNGLSIVAGASWGCLNLYFLKKFLKEYLRGNSREYLSCYTWMLIKFPLLYLFGFGLLKLKVFSVVSLSAGFSLIFLSMFIFGLKGVIKFKRAS